MPSRTLVSLSVAAALAAAGVSTASAQEPSADPALGAPDQAAPAPRKQKRRRAAATNDAGAATNGLAGRYAVMREKRDTGCMVTLDNARVKGGSRAQLAPGCRDQGIVVFDPSMWAFAQGELVLTARAGHKAHLLKDGEGAWKKDPKDGGKPLGLKRL